MNAVKRLSVIILCVSVLLCTLTSCSVNDGKNDNSSSQASALQSSQEDKSVRVTIVEGMTVRQIAARLEKKGVCSAEGFINALTEGDFDYEFLSEIEPNDDVYFALEGYIFPDTYEFYKDEDPKAVAKIFLKTFGKRINSVKQELDASGLTLSQAVTLASIVQKEASDVKNMPEVASVFANRLASPDFPKLQSDVTIYYVNDNITPFVEDEARQKEYAKAYNTYKCNGLPAGPICNPGLDAIKAAISPAQTDYYYFLTDNNAKYYYAETYEQHEANWAEAKAVNKSLEE